jgi:O-ureido-D-serine cyclo-ligase
MPAIKIALVTAAAARGLDEDLPPLEAALRDAGIDFHIVDWDDANTDWAQFELAVLRSTWDYTTRVHDFLAWADRASRATTLLNPLDVIRWNTDKHYLGDLARAGVPAVSSHFVEPGEDAGILLERFLNTHASTEFVVKPSVGAGSRDAQRYGHEERNAALNHVQHLLDGGRGVLLQPYLDRVDAQGETSLMYFNGVFSHAIRKGPLLRRGEDPTRALFAAEHITPRVPNADDLRVAEEALAAMPFEQPLLYARVDLIRDGADKPCVLELELTEPSLFFAHGANAAQRFAQAIAARVAT